MTNNYDSTQIDLTKRDEAIDTKIEWLNNCLRNCGFVGRLTKESTLEQLMDALVMLDYSLMLMSNEPFSTSMPDMFLKISEERKQQ